MKKTAVLMGSAGDGPIVKKATDILKEFGAPFEVHIFSAHRTPMEAAEFSQNARKNGFGVIIAAAGMAAHLAGAVASRTTLPVIGLPIKSGAFGGLDALLSTVQMPRGIPVAAVGVDVGENAALLALEILAVEDAGLSKKLDEYREKGRLKVLEQDSALNGGSGKYEA